MYFSNLGVKELNLSIFYYWCIKSLPFVSPQQERGLRTAGHPPAARRLTQNSSGRSPGTLPRPRLSALLEAAYLGSGGPGGSGPQHVWAWCGESQPLVDWREIQEEESVAWSGCALGSTEQGEWRWLSLWTPRKQAFLPCGHLDFESAVTVQNDEFKCSFHSSYSRLVNVETPRNSILSLHTLVKYKLCTTKMELALELKFHWVTRPWKWRQIRISADQQKWRQIRISADQQKWRQIRISVVSSVCILYHQLNAVQYKSPTAKGSAPNQGAAPNKLGLEVRLRSLKHRKCSENFVSAFVSYQVELLSLYGAEVRRAPFKTSAFAVCTKVTSPFLPRVIKFKFLQQPHQKYNITQYEELGFS